jgi:hypothetical protein
VNPSQEKLFSILREKYKNGTRMNSSILRNAKLDDILRLCYEYFSYETISSYFLMRHMLKEDNSVPLNSSKCSIFHQVNYRDYDFGFSGFTGQENKIIINDLYENCKTLKSNERSKVYELSERAVNEDFNILDKIIVIHKSIYNNIDSLIMSMNTFKKLKAFNSVNDFDPVTCRDMLTQGNIGFYKGIKIFVNDSVTHDTIFIAENERIGDLFYNIGVYKQIESKNLSPALILKEDFRYVINFDLLKKTSISGIIHE